MFVYFDILFCLVFAFLENVKTTVQVGFILCQIMISKTVPVHICVITEHELTFPQIFPVVVVTDWTPFCTKSVRMTLPASVTLMAGMRPASSCRPEPSSPVCTDTPTALRCKDDGYD